MTDETIHFNMTPEIAAAISAVMGKVRRLSKGEKNTYDNYNFTSIDQFLEFVNPLMAEAGLSVLYQEVGHEYYTNKKESLWMRVRYAFYFCHESGGVAGPFTRTVAVPMTGAQSYGSAQSYALKQFMRATFLIPTGERDDADFNQKDEHQAAPVNNNGHAREGLDEAWRDAIEDSLPEGAPPEQKAAAYCNAIIADMQRMKSQRGLDGIWAKRQRHIDRLQANWPDLYQNLLDAYQAAENSLKEGQAA